MKKQFTTINYIGSTLVLALGASVIMHSAHAKDAMMLAKSPAAFTAVKKAVPTDDPNAYKLVGDLHNHVDKHSFKSMNKAISDTNFATDPRSNRSQLQRDDDEASQFIDWLKRMLQSAFLFGTNPR
jgi:hypothetical protein